MGINGGYFPAICRVSIKSMSEIEMFDNGSSFLVVCFSYYSCTGATRDTSTGLMQLDFSYTLAIFGFFMAS